MKTQGSLYTLRGLAISIFFILFLSLIPASSHAHSIVESWQNRTGSGPGFSIGPKVTYFSTSQNFDLNSLSVPLANGISVQRYYIDLNLSYGFSENFFLYGRLSGLYTNVTGVGITDQTIFGMSDQMLGAAYRLFQNSSGVSINLQGEVTIPAYTVNSSLSNNKPWLGDGTYDFTGGAFLELPLTQQSTYQIYLDGGAGFTYRAYGFSSAVPWTILFKRYPTQTGLTLALGARGNVSLQTDTSNILRAPGDQLRGAGGSFIIDGINPSWTLGQASIGYQATNMSYTLSGAIPFTGTNSPDGFQVTFGVQFDFNGGSSKKTKSNVVRPGSFKEYDLESKVLSVNDQLYMVKIDQGSDRGVEKGQIFDIFIENQAIAKARVTNVKSEESVLRVLEYYKEQSIEVDAIAKRVVQDP